MGVGFLGRVHNNSRAMNLTFIIDSMIRGVVRPVDEEKNVGKLQVLLICLLQHATHGFQARGGDLDLLSNRIVEHSYNRLSSYREAQHLYRFLLFLIIFLPIINVCFE